MPIKWHLSARVDQGDCPIIPLNVALKEVLFSSILWCIGPEQDCAWWWRELVVGGGDIVLVLVPHVLVTCPQIGLNQVAILC